VNAEIRKCWAFARVNLHGLTEDDFWRLTPREFNILSEEWQRVQGANDNRTAVLCATIANASGGYDRTFTHSDFMYTPWNGEEPDLDAAFSILAQIKQ
jgi:hypothetical protein